MKRRLITLLLLTAGIWLGVEAQLLRQNAGEYITAPTAKMTTADAKVRIKAGALPGSTIRLHRSAPQRSLGTLKGTFQGVMTYPQASAGLYSFDHTGRKTAIWTSSDGVVLNAGFIADDILYAFYRQSSTSGGLQGIWLTKYDANTGEQLSRESFSLFEDFYHVVYAAAYNADEGVAYMICGQKDNANAYSMQKFNPATETFTEVSTLPSSTPYPMAMAWHPRNGGIYIIGEYATLERYNAEQGRFRTIGETSLGLDDEYGYTGSMTYSPLDEKFVALIETDAATGFYSIDPLTCATTAITSLGDDSQWLVLTCTDTTADPAAPGALTSASADFASGSLTGSLSVGLPTATVSGSALTGTLTVRVSEGKTVLSESVSGQPGATVTVPLTLEAGNHTLMVSACQTAGGKTLVGPATTVRVYTGFDAPAAPTDVVLSADKVTWTASKGATGGAVDASKLKYNVYIDGQLAAGSPVSGTELAVTLPAYGPVAHVAQVEAIAGDAVSPRASSNAYVGQQPFGLPCSIAPVTGESNLAADAINLFTSLDVNNDKRMWIYDEQKEQTGGFYYLCHSENKANDWLVLPQMKFPRAGYYRLSMEVSAGYQGYFADTESFEIGFGKEAHAPSLTVISDVTTLEPKKAFEPYELIFQVNEPGDYYIGIHCVTEANHYRLYARNFLVEAAGAAATPAAASDLYLTPADKGALSITATFTFPTVDTEGKTLDAGAPLTATVTCGENTETVTGIPGQKTSVTIGAVQGTNTVAVRIAGADGTPGPAASAETFAGVSVPGTVDLTKGISADNLTLTLSWKMNTVAPGGGYVDPATCTYTIMRRTNSGDWSAVAKTEAGATSWQYSVAAGTAQNTYVFGVSAENAAGAAETFTYIDAVLGALNPLPMKEVYRSQGETVINNYDPIQIQNIAEQYCSWGFVDPSQVDNAEGNDTETALMAYYQGYGQVTFPRFSTEGVDNVRISVSMLHGTMSSTEVVIAAVTPDDPFIPIETIDLSEGEGWQTTTVTLPVAALGKGWAGLALRCFNPTQFHHFMVDGYTIEAFNGTGLNIEALSAPSKLRLGRTATISATVANYSSQPQALPAFTAVFVAENGTELAMPLAADYTGVQVPRGDKMQIEFELTPYAEHLGYGRATVAIADASMVDQNASATARINVVKGYTPVITDLTATKTAGEHKLDWSHLVLADNVTEGAEDLSIWERGEQLGDFRNLDYDVQMTYVIGEFTYPGKYEPKAFEVFAGSEFMGVASVGDLLQAYDGDQYFIVFSPDSRATSPGNDWLVSPRIAGGSEVSFMIKAPDTTYGDEEIELLYSTTHDDTSAFTKLTTFTAQSGKWTECKATLPAGATYFALHYAGFDRFCLMVDNIVFTPYELGGTVTGYKVYANGKEIGSTAENSFTVSAPEASAVYYVVPQISVDGTTVAGTRSNAVSADQSGVDAIADTGSIKAVSGGVEITGFEGLSAAVYTPDGRLVASEASLPASKRIALGAGIYIVSAGNVTAKVVVE